MTCLAAYLYYNEPWEQLLTEALEPFAKQILADGLADQYFFIRYWERGPHIRLRFFGDESTLQNRVKPLLNEHFEAYFKQHHSIREDSEQIKLLPTEHQWFPNNSIQYFHYEPETERYGGPHALLVSEKHFQSSSDAILAAIAASERWSYERALGVAIQMHLSFAHAVGMQTEEIGEFYSYIFAGWLPMAYSAYALPLSKEEHTQKQEEVIDLFSKQFISQEQTLVPYHEAILEALSDNDEFEDEWLNKWISETQNIFQQLLALDKDGKVLYPDRYKFLSTYKTPEERQKLWTIYASYVHMTNNRLGIQNKDEGYLGYLIMKSLEKVVKEKV